MNEKYTLHQRASQARQLLELGPRNEPAVANAVEMAVRQITKRAPSNSPAARATDNVVTAVRGWFLGEQTTPMGLPERKAQLAAMIMALEERAEEFDDGTPA